jgi:hypothetical protein
MSFRGFALTIAGCPYLFTTGAVSTIPTSSSPLWFGADCTIATGYLHHPRARWTERAKPLDGDLELAPQTFSLHDAPLSSIGALVTRLATRDAINTTSTPLAASLTAAATSATVGDGSLFTAPCFGWIEGECVEVTAVASNTLTITRGALGTKAVAHTIDPAASRFPEVFTEFPWVVRRKVCLWGVDGANVATLLWAGFAVRAPALAEDGARYDLTADPLWTVLRQCPVGGSLGAARLVGYGRTGTTGRVQNTANAFLQSLWTLNATGARANVGSLGPFRDLEGALRDHEVETSARTTTAGLRVEAHLARSGRDLALNADALTATTAAFSCALTFCGETGDRVTSGWRTATRQALRITRGPVPSVWYCANANGRSNTWLVSSLAALPASWTATTTTDGTFSTTEQPALRVPLSDSWHVIFTPDPSFATGATDDGGVLGPRINGTVTVAPRKPGLTTAPEVVVLKDPAPLQVVYRVRADHWVYGIKRSVAALCEDGTADDWDWTGVDDVARATAGLRVAREWTFDGKRTLGSVVQECCQLHGCSPVLRSGRLALHAWGWPSAQATPANITKTMLVGRPTWTRWQEGLANRVQIKSADLVVDASQAGSRAKYGPGRQITVELAGLDEQTSPVDDPYDFARGVIGRMELWSEPLGVARFTVPADLEVGDGTALTRLELGRELTVSEWMLPDGAGGRGLSATRAVVVARDVDLGAASLTLDALLFPRLAYPYAPCGKVDSLISSTVVSLATSFVDGTSTYSGGEDAATFSAGDVVELIERDTTTLWTEQLTVASVDVALGRLTFTTALSATAQAKLAGSAWIDVRYAPFSACTTAQRAAWMFVGDDTTAVIGGTATRARPIAP